MFDVKAQSKAAYDQHCEIWRKNAREHSKFPQKKFDELKHTGIGRAMLLVATGYSLELNIETIKEYQHNVDIMCCDKSLGILLDHDITPKYCFVADAKVSYEKYLSKWSKDPRIEDVTLLINVCANPEWSHGAKWKEIYFQVNKDAIGYEKEFAQISGCPNIIMAGTNVSNAMLVFATQCIGKERRNFMGYDKYILIGYDYCWTYEGSYYAFNKDGDGKSNYMRHLYLLNNLGQQVYTSHNLQNSAQWITAYIKQYDVPVINCSDHTLVTPGTRPTLSEQMQYKLDPEDAEVVSKLDKELQHFQLQAEYVKNKLRELATKHYYGYVATIY